MSTLLLTGVTNSFSLSFVFNYPENDCQFRIIIFWCDSSSWQAGFRAERLGPRADYRLSADTYYLDNDRVIAVVGTLGTKTINATYTSLSVNWFPVLAGVLSRDDTVLEESAKMFKGVLADPELYTKFYVYYFARDCSGLYPYCKEVSRKMVPKGGAIKIAQRNYVTPGTNRAPDPYSILNPVGIKFDGSKRPPM